MIKKIFRGVFILLLTAALATGGFAWWIYHSPDTAPLPKSTKARLFWHNKVNPWDLQQVRDYCRKFGYNDTYYIICDFGMPSGKKRFYLYNLNSHRRIMSSYCMHGNGRRLYRRESGFQQQAGQQLLEHRAVCPESAPVHWLEETA